MSYIEIRKNEKNTHTYFVKRVALLKQSTTIKKYMGAGNILTSKNKFLLDNLELISKEEFKWRKKFLSTNLTFSQESSEKNELLAITINNSIEGKNCKDEVFAEFATEFIFNSNNIEGSKIPSNKIKEILETGDTSYAERNEVKEVQNSIAAFKYIEKSFKFNTASIKRVYHILTKDLYREGNKKYPKGFKKENNIVGNMQTSSWNDVEAAIESLLQWYKKNKKIIHPVELAFEFHYRYERIHPFIDGNGRTGRLLMNKILLANKYPPIMVYSENKTAYFNAFEKAVQGNMKKYHHFMLTQSLKSYKYIQTQISKY
jgi:Fic family protein